MFCPSYILLAAPSQPSQRLNSGSSSPSLSCPALPLHTEPGLRQGLAHPCPWQTGASALPGAMGSQGHHIYPQGTEPEIAETNSSCFSQQWLLWQQRCFRISQQNVNVVQRFSVLKKKGGGGFGELSLKIQSLTGFITVFSHFNSSILITYQ